MYKGKQFKEMVNRTIDDEDIVCIGEKKDELGRYDREIVGIETREVGFDNDNKYKAIVSVPYESNGALKFWR